jgi:hypothetical protein
MILLTGCIADIDTENPVFARFAQAGDKKDLSLADPRALYGWFAAHREAADEIDRICISRHVGTTWTGWITVEGRLCAAANRARRK